MGFFDEAFDAMTWKEVCCRLGGEGDLAINALKRRITNLDTLKMFFDNAGPIKQSTKALKEHINSILNQFKIDDVFGAFGDEKYQSVLFRWMDKDNITRFQAFDPTKLDIKFLFNITDAKNQAGLEALMNKILAEPVVNQPHLRAILRKADTKFLSTLLDKIMRDPRPEVRANILSVHSRPNQEIISELHKTIGLKALAKCADNPLASICVVGIKVFEALKPLERLVALERYMSFFPTYRKVPVFDPATSLEEFEAIMFAGCGEYDERVGVLKSIYKMITEDDLPEKKEET